MQISSYVQMPAMAIGGVDRETVGLFLPAEGRAIDIGVHINNLTLWSFIIFGIFNVVAGVVRSAGAVVFPLVVAFIAAALNVLYYRFGNWKKAK
ncbi:hypothetical protein [Paenibacillus sedimenti]|uniref:Uncharacterized protein n=1 Tax=Paenibacillus sedimenti TaxID=2770274 RepID=A0A926KVF7_9BACL|nr:hypothetical protein [Paenibacillus sedimenti]MBD0384262.1 hypothetical protein [Paenibacillus sedimenti]